MSDSRLRKIAANAPRTRDDLQKMYVLNEDELAQYSDEIVAVIIGAGESTEVVDAIRECVSAFPNQLPRSGVAKIFVGSESERVEQYQTYPLYNRLAGRSRVDVTLQVDALIEAGILQQNAKGYLM